MPQIILYITIPFAFKLYPVPTTEIRNTYIFCRFYIINYLDIDRYKIKKGKQLKSLKHDISENQLLNGD